MLNKNIEILSPVGDYECLKAAVQNGADAVYLGVAEFNARQYATNFDMEALEKAIIYAKTRGVKVHLVLNILVKNKEFENAFNIAKKAYKLGVDAIIVQDMGLALTLIKAFKDLPIHASTQMTVYNLEGVELLKKLGFERVVLSRELSVGDVEDICKNNNVEIETFIHGALCVSYSGQCLFSSMIGGRSGNRGKCAGTCRLPYELMQVTDNESEEIKINANNMKDKKIEIGEKVIDKGYLLSTRDVCGLEFLPNLVKAGVMCFKIEGRMKSPEYVATVTRIYRKYLDKIIKDEEYNIDKNDIKDLQITFNRGNFSSGYLKGNSNKNLVYKLKPNHMGVYLGKISKFNKDKGYITLKLENTLEIGDKISIDNNGISANYTVSELMLNKENLKIAVNGNTVTIGRMKGNIRLNDKVYLVESKRLSQLSTNSYKDVENVKQKVECELNIMENKRIEANARIMDGEFKNISCKITTNIIPEKAKSAPITKERFREQFNKTKNTIFEFCNININMEENLFLPVSNINEIRRMILENLENKMEKAIKRNVEEKENSKILNDIKNRVDRVNEESENNKKPQISVLLNILNAKCDYSKLNNVDNLYIPLKYFFNLEFDDILKKLSERFKLYVYMPTVMRKNYQNLVRESLGNIIKKFSIKGAVISNIGQISSFKNYDIDIVGNYTLNILNNISLDYYKDLGVKNFTLSPELDRESLVSLTSSNGNMNLIVYGMAPVMNSGYCVLGKTNKCYRECPRYCRDSSKKYYLKDRLGFKFRVISDNVDTISTIYNSKITSIKWKDYNTNSLRIDILDEDVDTINSIVLKTLNNERFEGKEYTNANINKVI